MVMEKQSLIISLMVADAKYASEIVVVKDLPDSVSLMSHFIACPFISEKAQMTEQTQDTDHGHLINFNINVSVDRDNDFYRHFHRKPLLLYIETINGERYYIGSDGNPSRMEYGRKSGTTITDGNETELTFTHTKPQ